MSKKKCFETIMIFSDKLTEEEYQKKVRYYKKWFTELPATKIKTDKLGKRKLAYEIRGCKYGYYTMFMYNAAEGLISSSLEETLRKEDEDKAPADQAVTKSEQKKKPVDVLNLIYGLED